MRTLELDPRGSPKDNNCLSNTIVMEEVYALLGELSHLHGSMSQFLQLSDLALVRSENIVPDSHKPGFAFFGKYSCGHSSQSQKSEQHSKRNKACENKATTGTRRAKTKLDKDKCVQRWSRFHVLPFTTPASPASAFPFFWPRVLAAGKLFHDNRQKCAKRRRKRDPQNVV